MAIRKVQLSLEGSDYQEMKREKDKLRMTWDEYIVYKCLNKEPTRGD